MKYTRMLWLPSNKNEKQHIEAVKILYDFSVDIIFVNSLIELEKFIDQNYFVVIGTEYAHRHFSEIKELIDKNPSIFINLHHYDIIEALPQKIYDLLDYKNNIAKPDSDRILIEKFIFQINQEGSEDENISQ